MHQILIVEDDPALSQGIRLALGQEGRQFVQAGTIGQAERELAERTFDLLILDLNLPDGNGLDLLSRLRDRSALPVLILTANDLEMDQVTGLELGADDYVTKPFSMPVLLKKIAAILRRAGGVSTAPPLLRYGELTLDPEAVEVRLAGRSLELTAREFELLHTFLSSPGRVFTREVLLAKLWGYDFFGDERIVDSHIKNLRKKLLGLDCIETVRGVGYRAAKEN